MKHALQSSLITALIIVTTGIHLAAEPPEESADEMDEAAQEAQKEEWDDFRDRLGGLITLRALLPLNPADETDACVMLKIAVIGDESSTQSLPCETGHMDAYTSITAMKLPAGKYRLFSAGKLPTSLAARFESIAIEFRVVMEGDGDRATLTELRNESRRISIPVSLCIRVISSVNRIPMENVSVSFYQDFVLHGTGITGKSGLTCINDLRYGAVVINVRGGSFLARLFSLDLPVIQPIVDVAVEPAADYTCQWIDRHGFARLHPGMRLWLVDYPEFEPGTGIPQIILYVGWGRSAKDEELHAPTGDRYELKLIPSLVDKMLDGRETVNIELRDENGMVLNYAIAAADFRSNCKLTLPIPDPRTFRVRLTCPDGQRVPTHLPVFLTQHPSRDEKYKSIYRALSLKMDGINAIGEFVALSSGQARLEFGVNGCVTTQSLVDLINSEQEQSIPAGNWCEDDVNSKSETDADWAEETRDRSNEDRTSCFHWLDFTQEEIARLVNDRTLSCSTISALRSAAYLADIP